MRCLLLALLLSGSAFGLAAADKKPTPPLRTRAEVEAALAKSRPADERAMRQLKRIVLVASEQDHGPGEHDYPAWQKAWLKLLAQAEGVSVTNAWKWPTEEQFEKANLLVFYYWNHKWTPEVLEQLDAFLARGGGIVLLHSSCISDNDPETLAEHIGFAAHPKRSKYRHGELDLKLVTASDHPLTIGLPRTMHLVDETYWQLIGDTNKVKIIATAEEEGKDWPMVWTFSRGKGRVFGTVLGHYYTTFDDPFFRLIVLRGMAWAAGDNESYFQKLCTAGVTFKD